MIRIRAKSCGQFAGFACYRFSPRLNSQHPCSSSSVSSSTLIVWLLATMYDQPRSPPSAARFTSRPDSPSSQQRHDADSSQSTSNSFNVRTSSRNAGLHRASTVDVPHDKPQAQASVPTHPASDQGHARPSDLTLTQGYGSSSRPSSRGGPSSYTDESRLGSSYKSTNYSTSNVSQTSSNNSSPTTSNIQLCSACGLAMSGQFVRALGSVYHLDCFRCRVCLCWAVIMFVGVTLVLFTGLQQCSCAEVLPH